MRRPARRRATRPHSDSTSSGEPDLSNYGDVDLETLTLNVERILFKWNAQESRYDTHPDLGDSSDANDGPPQYTPKAAFAIVRTFSPTDKEGVFSVSKKIHAWSPHFVQAAKDVMSGFFDIAWGAKPLKVWRRHVESFAILIR